MLKRMLGAAAMLALGAALPAHATTVSLSPDSTWHAFDVSDVLSTDNGLGWFDFNSLTGDALEFAIDVAAGQTRACSRWSTAATPAIASRSSTTACSLGLDLRRAGGWRRHQCRISNFDAALANASFSRGFFFLGAGLHRITGLLSQSSLDALNSTVGGHFRRAGAAACLAAAAVQRRRPHEPVRAPSQDGGRLKELRT